MQKRRAREETSVERRERVDRLRETARALAEHEWGEIDFLLRQFGCPITDLHDGTAVSYCLAMMDDIENDELRELHQYLLGSTPSTSTSDAGPWEPGYLRVFFSHLSTHKGDVEAVRQALLDYGLDGFVAHVDIEVSKEWMDQVEVALATCDALVAFLHAGFVQSIWADQEVGYCLARNVPVVPLMFGSDPHGFLSRYQGAPCEQRAPEDVAELVYRTLHRHPSTQERTWTAGLAALGNSRSYREANRRAKRLFGMPKWDSERLDALEEALTNGEVNDSWNAGPWARRVLEEHGRLPRDQPPDTNDVPF